MWLCSLLDQEKEQKERKLVRQNKGMEETATISSLLPPRTVPQKVPETTVARLPDITVSQGDHYRRPEAVAHFPATLWQGTKGGSRRAVSRRHVRFGKRLCRRKRFEGPVK